MVSIYKITNERSGACYIGSSRVPTRRWGKHLQLLKKGIHNPRFQMEWDKTNPSDWTFRILEDVLDNQRNIREAHYYRLYSPKLCLVDIYRANIRSDIDQEALFLDIQNGTTYREIAKKYGVSVGLVCKINKSFRGLSNQNPG